MRGRLTEWNDERGFGFVTSLDDQSRAFVHVSEFPHESRRPQVLDLITYDLRHDDRGRLQACEVRFLAPVRARSASLKPPSSGGSIGREVPVAVPLVPLGAVILVGLLLRPAPAAGFLLGYVIMSLATFAAYAADKSAAVRGKFRTQESALHLLELAGGWPGALIAQRVFRHKTKKESYQIAFWVCVVLNVGALVFALSAASPG